MELIWQQIIIGACVALSVLYLVYYLVRRRKDRGSACGNCPAIKIQKTDDRRKSRFKINI